MIRDLVEFAITDSLFKNILEEYYKMEQFDMLVCDKMEIDSVGTEEGYNTTSDYNMELIEYYKSDTIFKILPTEIVLKIISFLDEDTVTVGRVCKYWNGLAFREIYDRGMAEMEVYQVSVAFVLLSLSSRSQF